MTIIALYSKESGCKDSKFLIAKQEYSEIFSGIICFPYTICPWKRREYLVYRSFDN